MSFVALGALRFPAYSERSPHHRNLFDSRSEEVHQHGAGVRGVIVEALSAGGKHGDLPHEFLVSELWFLWSRSMVSFLHYYLPVLRQGRRANDIGSHP